MSRNVSFEQNVGRVPHVPVHTQNQQQLLNIFCCLTFTSGSARIKTESVLVTKIYLCEKVMHLTFGDAKVLAVTFVIISGVGHVKTVSNDLQCGKSSKY